MLDNLVWIMLVVVLAIFSLTIPHYFQIGIFANIIEQSTFVGVMAIGLAIVHHRRQHGPFGRSRSPR